MDTQPNDQQIDIHDEQTNRNQTENLTQHEETTETSAQPDLTSNDEMNNDSLSTNPVTQTDTDKSALPLELNAPVDSIGTTELLNPIELHDSPMTDVQKTDSASLVDSSVEQDQSVGSEAQNASIEQSDCLKALYDVSQIAEGLFGEILSR